MKKLSLTLLLSIFLTINVFAGKGMILVLEAPLFKKESFDSRIVQHVKKGEVIFIHDKDIDLSPDEISFQSSDRKGYLNNQDFTPNSFYETLDKNGNTVFIPKKFVKLILNDSRENQESISPFAHDPTDYRLLEPLDDNYPLVNPNHYRFSFAIGYGPSLKENYDYNQQIIHHRYRNPMGIDLTYTRNVTLTYGNRIFVGGMFSFYSETAKFKFENYRTANEYKNIISLGPFLSYDAFRNNNYLITLFSNISLRYHLTKINQSSLKSYGRDASGNTLYDEIEDDSIYKGYSVSGTMGASLQKKITSSIYAFLGPSITVTSPSVQKNSVPHLDKTLWDQEYENYNSSFNANFKFFLGIMSIL